MTGDIDVEHLAASATQAVACCDHLISSPRMTPADRKALAGIRDFIIEQAASFARLSRSTAEMDGVLFGGPAVLEAAIRDRLTPGQCAQLAERLSGE